MKSKVRGNILQTDDAAIEVGTQRWFSWLETPANKGFSFENEFGNISVRKEKRASSRNTYWTGCKRSHGKLRRVYIGTSPQLTLDKLAAVCKEINQSEEVFWASRKSYTTKDCVTELDKNLSKEVEGDFDQVQHRNRKLENPLKELRSQIANLKAENQQLKSEKAKLETQLKLKKNSKRSNTNTQFTSQGSEIRGFIQKHKQ